MLFNQKATKYIQLTSTKVVFFILTSIVIGIFLSILLFGRQTSAMGVISSWLPNDWQRLVVAGPSFDFGGNVSRSLLYSAPGSPTITARYRATAGNASEVQSIAIRNYNISTKTCGSSVLATTWTGNPVDSDVTLTANSSNTSRDLDTNRYVYCIQVTARAWAGDSPFYLTTNANQLVGNDVANRATKTLGTGYIYDDTPFSGDPVWSKQISFGTPCRTTTYRVDDEIGLFDLDVGNNGAWTQGTIRWRIFEVTPTGAFVRTISDRYIFSTSANNQSDTFRVPLETNKKYRLFIENLNGVNAIKVALPYSQLDFTKDCTVQRRPMRCSNFTGLTGTPGSYQEVRFRVWNRTSFTWVASGARYEIGVVDPGFVGWNANDVGTTFPWNDSSGRGPPDHQSGAYLRNSANGVQNTWRSYTYNRDANNGATPHRVERYGTNVNIGAGGYRTFSAWVRIPSTNGATKDYGIRMLSRDARFGPWAWMDWDSSCRFTVTADLPNTAPSARVRATCTVVTGSTRANIRVTYDQVTDAEQSSLTLSYTNPTGGGVSFGVTRGTSGSRTYNVARRSSSYSITNIRISDGTATTNIASITGIRCPLPPPPTAVVTAACAVISGSTQATITVTYGSVADSENSPLTLSYTNPSGGAVSFGLSAGASGSRNYTVARSATAYSIRNIRISNGSTQTTYPNITGISCPLPSDPTISIDSLTCGSMVVTVGNTQGFTYDVVLYQGTSAGSTTATTVSPSASGNTYTFDITSWRDISSRYFRVVATSTSYASASASTPTDTPGPCVTVTCGSVTPASAGLGSLSFNTTFAFSLSPSLGSQTGNKSYSADMTFNGSSLALYTTSTGTATTGQVNSGTGTASVTMYRNNVPTPTTPGVYPINIDVTVGSVTEDCDNTINILQQPYFRTYGNDLISCGGSTGFVRATPSSVAGTHASYLGAASELAIFAVGQINGVLPGSMQSTRVNLQDLAFSNTVNVATATADYGGGFGSCYAGSDYEDTSTLSGLTSTVSSDVSTVSSGRYQHSGGALSGVVGTGQRIVIYVGGTARIGGDITYQGNSWPDVSSIPSFTLIATGDIFIDSSVSQLDGHYVSTGGDIHTCSGVGANVNLLQNTPVDRAALAGICQNKLTVNGSFKAQQIHFLRTNGTITDGTALEAYNSPNLAESFRFSPETYLVNGGGLLPNVNSNPNIDSLVSRPPSF